MSTSLLSCFTQERLSHAFHWRPTPGQLQPGHVVRLYMCRRGLRGILGTGGSATDAYRQVYGRHRKLKLGSIRSAGARLARQPWMRAALILDRRLIYCGGRLDWPCDLRNNGQKWLALLRSLNRFGDWPADLAIIVRNARTYEEAVDGIRGAKTVQQARVYSASLCSQRSRIQHIHDVPCFVDASAYGLQDLGAVGG